MSLPLAFTTRIATIPASVPYLFPDTRKQAAWQQYLGERSAPRVGLVWSGSGSHKNDHNRSIPLQQLEALLALPCEFHSLQQEIRPQDATFMARCGTIHDHRDRLTDFSDTAALTAAMDLVISVDTSVAHLAGATGRKLWVLLPWVPDFRWLLDRQDSPWYPSAVLFRQPAAGDWHSVILLVRQQLEAMLQDASDSGDKKSIFNDRPDTMTGIMTIL